MHDGLYMTFGPFVSLVVAVATSWIGVVVAVASVMVLAIVVTVGRSRLGHAAYRAVFDAMREPALVVRSDGTVVEANPAAARLLAAGAPLRGTNLMAVAPQLEAARRAHRTSLSGDLAGYAMSLAPVPGRRGERVKSVVILHDQRRERAREAQLAARVRLDPLTSVANRAGFEAAVAEALASRGGRPLGIAFVDLDGFKGVNDRLGHAAGDTVLVEVARRLGESLRDGDVVGRLGGDEFALLLRDVTPDRLATVAERVHRHLARPVHVDGEAATVGASIGLASAPRDGDRVDELLAHADARMYRQKQSHSGRSSRPDAHRPAGEVEPAPHAGVPTGLTPSPTRT